MLAFPERAICSVRMPITGAGRNPPLQKLTQLCTQQVTSPKGSIRTTRVDEFSSALLTFFQSPCNIPHVIILPLSPTCHNLHLLFMLEVPEIAEPGAERVFAFAYSVRVSYFQTVD
ncbi:MAG: hypothetical protein JWQ40_1179 [Segetibacter sp.]|nr:hypothetical protein [Segetibacter sp.]